MVLVELLLNDYEVYKEGKKCLVEVIVGFNDLVDEELVLLVVVVDDSVDVDVEGDEDEDDDVDGGDEEVVLIGLDLEEVVVCM